MSKDADEIAKNDFECLDVIAKLRPLSRFMGFSAAQSAASSQGELKMKNIWVAIVMFALLDSAGIAQEAGTKDAEVTHVLSRPEFDALLAHPERLLIVDVRRPDEIAAIGGFDVYLSIQPADVQKSLALIPRERTIVTVSNHANRAIRVATVLAANGFKVAGTLGAQNYEEQGGTLIKVAPPAPAATQPNATH